jgi:hypothetical protein
MLNAGGIVGKVQVGSDADLNNDTSGGREHLFSELAYIFVSTS